MIIRTFEGLQALTTPSYQSSWSNSHGLNLYDHHQEYAEIYRTQPNVRICVDFLARNIAQLGLHVFRRISDTDRERLATHDLATWIGRPNPATRRYRLMESLIGDLGIYFSAYWLKVRYTAPTGRAAIGLVRLPPEQMSPVGGLLPDHFCWTVNGRVKEFPLSEIIYFNGYNPCPDNPLMGLSPLETLRRILSEEAAAGDNRESYWRNAGRMEGVITQAKDGPDWKKPQQDEFRQQWQEFSGGGAKAGMTAVLPRGMDIKPWSFSARDSEYVLGGKLRREVCAAAYHIPQPMVGILDHATFSNIKEQHKHLYQDSLGPWLEMIQQEIEGQLLIECDDQRDVYTEFNIGDKLKGSFEEQATSLQQLVGRPVMTANEGRARLNLPKITDDPSADTLAQQQGGPSTSGAAPVDGNPQPPTAARDVSPVLHATRERQRSRLAKLPVTDRPATFAADLDRWNRELAEDLAKQGCPDAPARAAAANAEMLAQLEADAVEARVTALEHQTKTKPAVTRTFHRDANGLVESFTDAVLEEV